MKVGLIAYCVLFSLIAEALTRSQARAQLTAMSSRQSENTVHDLLNLICDAVVFLDARLNIDTPSPKLDGLLLRRTDPGELCGTPFAKYVLESDAQRFLDFVQEDTSQSLHLNMRDMGGAHLRVQLFHTAFEDVFQQTHHVLGVREEMDSTIQRELPLADTPAPLFSSRLRREGSFSSGNSGEFVVIKSCDAKPVAVWVDVLGGGLPIVGCTTLFSSLAGRPVEQGESFLAWVQGDKSAFMLWVQTMVNGANTEESFKVTWRSSLTNKMEIRSTCKMCVEEGDEEDIESDEPSCVWQGPDKT